MKKMTDFSDTPRSSAICSLLPHTPYTEIEASESLQKLLCKRFDALWGNCLNSGAVSNGLPVYDELSKRYSDPRRGYHNLDHIRHCLQELDSVASLDGEYRAIEMALWFHDVVYKPGSWDNERKSADLFARVADGHMPADFVQTVCRLILVTSHRERPRDNDERLINDIDLSSFGLPWDEFLRDTHNLRKERDDLADTLYFPKQMTFLKCLIDRPRIFETEFFYERYEESARENIQKFLDVLHEEGYANMCASCLMPKACREMPFCVRIKNAKGLSGN